MSDYSGKVYRKIGGDEIVVANGGKITIESGGSITNGSENFTNVTFDTDYFTVSEGVVTLKTEVAALLTIVGNIPTEDPADNGVSIWNDGGVLKVSGASA